MLWEERAAAASNRITVYPLPRAWCAALRALKCYSLPYDDLVSTSCVQTGRDIEDSCGEEQCTKLRCYRYESIKLMLAGPRAATTTTITVTTLTS